MSTNLDIAAGLLSANTTYDVAYEGFYAAAMPGPYRAYTEVIPNNTKRLDLNWLTNHPVMRKWLGARVEKALRHYNQTIGFDKWEATLPIKRDDLVYDNTNAVARAIDTFFSYQISAYDSAVFSEWISSSGAGPTCFDGVALFSASHVHGPSSTTQSNLSSGTALSHAALVTALSTMRTLQFENGEPMDINPGVLEVGPKLEVRAKELLSADRLQTATAANAFDSGTAIAAATRSSVWAGEYTLVINQRMAASGTGHYYWTLMDVSKPGVRPMIVQENRFPEAVRRTDMTDPRRWSHDEFLFGLEGDWGVAPGMWTVAHRGTGTA